MSQPENPLPASTGALIYVVDDEGTICEMVEAVLTMAGHRVLMFTDPAAAVAAFLKADPKPALVMTDYVMPDMNGSRLIGIVKAAKPGLKTILFSGHVQGHFLHGRGEQPDHFLTKPFSAELLTRAVAQVLKS